MIHKTIYSLQLGEQWQQNIPPQRPKCAVYIRVVYFLFFPLLYPSKCDFPKGVMQQLT